MELKSEQDTKNKKVRQQIFDEETEFDYSDFFDLKNNKAYDRFFAGNLKLTTGQVVCVDPMALSPALPQTWSVPKGDYPVYLYIGLEGDFAGRVAYAELNIKDAIPDYWELSLISEKLLTSDFEKKLNGMYPVDAGLSCFSDFETLKIYEQEVDSFYALNKNRNYYADILEKHFKQNASIPKSSRGEDWINYKPSNANGNIVMFGSGWGDGLYPRYVGFNRNGDIVKFVTEFIQLSDETE